jgi:hypothetical protein
MKPILIALALACSGCSLTDLPAPNSVADATVLDEKLGIAVETTYAAAARTAALAIRAGLVDAAGARRISLLNEQARAAVLLTRQAYDAGNAVTYTAAASQALGLINSIIRAAGGQP